MYKKTIPSPAKTQNVERAFKEEDAPSQNAIALVIDVIVIDAPAFFIPSIILFLTDCFASV